MLQLRLYAGPQRPVRIAHPARGRTSDETYAIDMKQENLAASSNLESTLAKPSNCSGKQDRLYRAMSDVGGEAKNICSLRDLPFMTRS